jgi:hypothetical protein
MLVRDVGHDEMDRGTKSFVSLRSESSNALTPASHVQIVHSVLHLMAFSIGGGSRGGRSFGDGNFSASKVLSAPIRLTPLAPLTLLADNGSGQNRKKAVGRTGQALNRQTGQLRGHASGAEGGSLLGAPTESHQTARARPLLVLATGIMIFAALVGLPVGLLKALGVI